MVRQASKVLSKGSGCHETELDWIHQSWRAACSRKALITAIVHFKWRVISSINSFSFWIATRSYSSKKWLSCLKRNKIKSLCSSWWWLIVDFICVLPLMLTSFINLFALALIAIFNTSLVSLSTTLWCLLCWTEGGTAKIPPSPTSNNASMFSSSSADLFSVLPVLAFDGASSSVTETAWVSAGSLRTIPYFHNKRSKLFYTECLHHCLNGYTMHECSVHTLGTCGQLILVIPLPHISLWKHNLLLHLGYSLFPFVIL